MPKSNIITFTEFIQTFSSDDTERWHSGRAYTEMLIVAQSNRKCGLSPFDDRVTLFENSGRGGLAGLINDQLEHSTWSLEETHQMEKLHPYRLKFPEVSFQLASRWADAVRTAPLSTQAKRDMLINYTPRFIEGAFILFMVSMSDKPWADGVTEKFPVNDVDDLEVARIIKVVIATPIEFGAMPSTLPQYPPSYGRLRDQA